jgi:hypothetical protein
MKRRRITAGDEADQKAMAEAREIARLHAAAALEELARLASGATSESVRVAAAKEILDRAHGRPAAAQGEGGGSLQHLLVDDGF